MFNSDFYPTPTAVIERMLQGYNVASKVCLEPEGGKGNIVDFLKIEGAADVIACEINQDLKKILQTKCKIIADNFLSVESYQISHVDFIIMNPPFSSDEEHILHAYNIAPAGSTIISLANLSTIEKNAHKGPQTLKEPDSGKRQLRKPRRLFFRSREKNRSRDRLDKTAEARRKP